MKEAYLFKLLSIIQFLGLLLFPSALKAGESSPQFLTFVQQIASQDSLHSEINPKNWCDYYQKNQIVFSSAETQLQRMIIISQRYPNFTMQEQAENLDQILLQTNLLASSYPKLTSHLNSLDPSFSYAFKDLKPLINTIYRAAQQYKNDQAHSNYLSHQLKDEAGLASAILYRDPDYADFSNLVWLRMNLASLQKALLKANRNAKNYLSLVNQNMIQHNNWCK